MLNEQLAHFHEQRDEMIEQVRAYAASIETLRNQMLPIKERERERVRNRLLNSCIRVSAS